MNTCRCGICNRTNNPGLITYPEQYYGGVYRRDPFYPEQDVCGECDDSVYDATLLWESGEDGEDEDEDD